MNEQEYIEKLPANTMFAVYEGKVVLDKFEFKPVGESYIIKD